METLLPSHAKVLKSDAGMWWLKHPAQFRQASQLVAGMDFCRPNGALLIQNDAFDGARLDKGKSFKLDEPASGLSKNNQLITATINP